MDSAIRLLSAAFTVHPAHCSHVLLTVQFGLQPLSLKIYIFKEEKEYGGEPCLLLRRTSLLHKK